MGKAALIFVVGMTIVMGRMLVSSNEQIISLSQKITARYEKIIARYIVISGANIALSNLSDDPESRTNIASTSFNGGTFAVTVTDLDTVVELSVTGSYLDVIMPDHVLRRGHAQHQVLPNNERIDPELVGREDRDVHGRLRNDVVTRQVVPGIQDRLAVLLDRGAEEQRVEHLHVFEMELILEERRHAHGFAHRRVALEVVVFQG